MANTGESDHQYIKLTSLAQRFGVWEVMEGSLYIWNKQHKKVKCIPFFIPFQGTTTAIYRSLQNRVIRLDLRVREKY